MSAELPDAGKRIERFIREQFMVRPDDPHFSRTTDLYENGFVDSVGVVELLAFIDEEFGVEIPEKLLLSKDFSNIDGIAGIVDRLR
jgi:acyl carrier protein